ASLGFAILGTLLVTQMRHNTTSSLVAQGLPHRQAAATASTITNSQGNSAAGPIPHFIRLDFAHSIRTVLLAMAIVMAASAVVALFGLRRGVQAESDAPA
ncbi:MAG TPA: hypothetical protein VLW05_08485, partial [Gaiellaceae bacterium]|nr:hypothetical protein [Gaiellaceae bacterium]